jgi:1-acyl-sn-glycerol-3-phosphate acyltransferase
MQRNVFGQPVWVKRVMLALFGLLSWPRFNLRYTPVISGAENYTALPDANVLIVSNHQTYFADVIFIQHAIHSAMCGRVNNIRFPGFLVKPKLNIYFVAAEETMKSGLLPRIMAAGGAITVKRTWRAKGADTQRAVDLNDVSKVLSALGEGWVISFPQGTTSPFMPGRKGTAHIIKQSKAVVVPVVIDGFRRAFDKKGLKTKKRGVTLKMTIKPPLNIDYEADAEIIIDQVMEAIEQKEEFLTVN